MENKTFSELIETNIWRIRKLSLPNATSYLQDVEYIVWADTGLITALNTNLFFQESCQMIVNAINIFQEGYFDAAFYSLRQSIENSIGTLYLSARPETMDSWQKLEKGFEKGKMAKFLRDNEPNFSDIRSNMSKYFENINKAINKINKYIHKQGFISFYSTKKSIITDKETQIYKQITSDFEQILKISIGAVAVYRLTIDPLPILLMNEDIRFRTGDLVTEPYSEHFVQKYIGEEHISAYKNTNIYKEYKKSIMSCEKQNEAIFNIIHFQYINREALNDINEQINLLTLSDRMALAFILISDNITLVYIDEIFLYTSNTTRKDSCISYGYPYCNEFFEGKNDFNAPLANGAYLSRIKGNKKFTFIESNIPLNEIEIEIVKKRSEQFKEVTQKIDKEIEELIEIIKANKER